MELSIVIPAHNEEHSVEPLYAEISQALEAVDGDCEVIFVDDGSWDGTFQRLQALHQRDGRVKVVRLRKNFGQSAAMAAGFDHARGRLVVTMDADLQNDPADIPALLARMEDGYDVVCGWRRRRRDPLSKRALSAVSNWLRRRWTGDPIHDSGCSLRAYRQECIEGLELYGEMHRYIPAILSWRGYHVGEAEVSHRPRLHGRTKYGFQRVPKGFLDLLLITFWQRYSLRPIHVFGGSGLLLAFVSVALGIYLLVEKFAYNAALGDRPLLLLAVLLFIVGVQFIVFGVLADIMIRVYYGQGGRKNYVVEQVIE